jgi:nucleoside-diphosphate-sugar epimerase
MRVLVTGATGFIGGAVTVRAELDPELEVCGTGHNRAAERKLTVDPTFLRDLAPDTDWAEPLNGVDVVVHAAARVHVMHDLARDPLAEFRRVNVAGTLALARQASDAGVRRFVFISSIKVNGERTLVGCPFTADDIPSPSDAYGVSKLEAEEGLRRISTESGLEVVIIRPVLVYGPGVKANFLSLLRWMNRSAPLPFGSMHNKRSLVALDNLVDLVVTCLRHPGAANQTFLVSDGEDLSITALLLRVAQALGKTARLVPVPLGVLALVAQLLGEADRAQRLCGSLQVDIAKTRALLGWEPPVTVDEGLELAAEHFLRTVNKSGVTRDRPHSADPCGLT